MIAANEPSIATQIHAAFDWWRDAGVDCDFLDEPRDWVAPVVEVKPVAVIMPAATLAAAEPDAPPAMGGDKAGWPQDLASFAAWWLAEPSLDNGQVMDRVAPRGVAGAELMILIDEPEAEDRETLLSGPQGRLVDGMLAAMGIAPEQTYIASALPRHTPLADWQGLAAQDLAAITRHHIALAAPKRLIVFSSNIPSLLGNDPTNSADVLRHFNHEGVSLPYMAAMDLAQMLARPRIKGRLWQLWLEWTGTATA